MADCVTFEALGSGQVMRLTTGAGRRLERQLGVPFGKMLTEIEERMGFEFLVAFFAACLNDGRGVKEQIAEAVIDDIGGLQAAAELLGECVQASLPAPAEGKATEGNAAGA